MRVKIGSNIYDSREEPIMIILDENDKKNIANMEPWATKFCSSPNGWDHDMIFEWMDEMERENKEPDQEVEFQNKSRSSYIFSMATAAWIFVIMMAIAVLMTIISGVIYLLKTISRWVN